ncbi:trace amine-associated receptor 9-like [Actinia tenebrosa]|uniref:Trace amine-associated receptor 9-like n=1 Tax=Actinia tenebrosa TaxID=6105 RepID=A0A6P8HC45_ACTTE|nr:trace amine-associated receptor 9-like [Actinia tenebrosa]
MSNSNQSSPSLTYAPHPWTVWYWSLRGIIAIIAVLGNGIVVWLIISRRKLWTRPNCFVLSLSLADFCAGAINTPLELYCTMLGTSCSSWLVQAIKDMFIVASVFNLCAMTIDRYVAVTHSLRYPRIMNDKTCVLVIATAWGLGISIPWIFYIIRIREFHTYRIISIFRLLFCNALPMAGLVLAYFRMLRISRKHRRKVGQQRQQVDFNYLSKRRVNERSENRSAVRFIGSMVAFFVFCYSLTFYRVLSSYILFISVPYVIVPISRLLYYMNSALNCLVYALFKKDIRREARNLFCRTGTEQ